jgi:hypothetical protein
MSKSTSTWIIRGTVDGEQARETTGRARDTRSTIAEREGVAFDRVFPVFAS